MECVLNDPKHYSLLKDWKVTDEIEIVLHFHDPEFSVGSKKRISQQANQLLKSGSF